MPNEQQKIKSVAQFQNDGWGTPIPLGANAENIDITNITENPSSDVTNTSAGLVDNNVTVAVGDTDATAWTKFNRFRKRVQNAFGTLAGKTFTNNYEQSNTDNKIYSATIINNQLAARGLPTGGSDGDVLVKNGAGDYDARWTKTPPQMGSLATIEETRQAQNNYNKRDFLVYDGQLYFANEDIFAGTDLNPGANIISTNMGYFARRINNFLGVGNTAVNYNIDTMTVATRYSGIYFYNGYDANLQGTLPFTGAYGLFFVTDNGSGDCVQIAINIATGKIYRRQYPGIWPNWSISN